MKAGIHLCKTSVHTTQRTKSKSFGTAVQLYSEVISIHSVVWPSAEFCVTQQVVCKISVELCDHFR